MSEIQVFWLSLSTGKVKLVLDGVEYPVSLTLGEEEVGTVLTYLTNTFKLEVRHYYLHP